MPEHIPFIRIFVSSPGDVNDERKIALEVIEQLPYRPTFREKVAFRVIAWDKPGAGTPMRATLTPQDAINKGLPTPAECDIVIVLFWSRMGTSFTDNDGTEYFSGTHWELLNALEAKRPETVIYRRTDDPPFKITDADFDQKHAQYKTVQNFFKSDLFYAADGKIKRGINMYKTPDDFRRAFEIDLEVLVLDILKRGAGGLPPHEPETDSTADDENISTIRAVDWPADKSPFPGLRAFTQADAPIFFGRGYETDALVQQLMSSRFVAVVGASGSGKSSLVGAGLLPRLRANAIASSKDWQIARFTPGENPFASLHDALLTVFPQFKPNPMEARRIKQNFIADLREEPRTLLNICAAGLEDAPEWAEILLFVDQFEELFTLAAPDLRQSFAEMLMAESDNVRVVVTLRADFYHRAIPYLEKPLRTGSFTLAAPSPIALYQMITRPAERAALQFDNGLPEQILDDTGTDPGALALMAYALDELYKIAEKRGDHCLTFADYEALGGVQGAIGRRAEGEYANLPGEEDGKAALLKRVFHQLLTVDEEGTTTRKRAMYNPETMPVNERKLIYQFVEARLLTADQSNDRVSVEVAHEAILWNWKRLADWIEETQDDRIIVRRMVREAEEWNRLERPYSRLPNAEEIAEFQEACNRLGEEVVNPVVRDFTEPEQERLLRELEDINTIHQRRFDIGERLARIGDTRLGVGLREDGLPDIEWLLVAPGGEIVIKGQVFTVQPFYIARYLVTHKQFQAFIDSGEYADRRWWDGFPEEYQPQQMRSATNGNVNAPRDMVTWYQSVAFTRWLNYRMQGLVLFDSSTRIKSTLNNADNISTKLIVGENAIIRLPTEWEWQWAAQGGMEAKQYPWGEWDDMPRANTTEAGINDRSTSVGMYPHGAAACGALDIAGNVYEWCLNKYDALNQITVDNSGDKRARRGGSAAFIKSKSCCDAGYRSDPHDNSHRIGLRVICGGFSHDWL